MSEFRRKLKESGHFIEGERHNGTHVHYDSSGGSDRPVNVRNEQTGEGLNLRTATLKEADDFAKRCNGSND